MGFDIEKVDRRHLPRYRKETKALLAAKVRTALLLGISLIPLFSILDYVAFRKHFKTFFYYRIGCSLGLIILLICHSRKSGKDYPFAVAVAAYILTGMTIAMMVVKTGGYDSFYYVGIVMVLVTCAAILPLTLFQAAALGILLYLVYAVPIFLFNEPTSDKLSLFFNNSFFFFAFIVITLVQCHDETRSRIREFNLKMELDAMTKQLSYHAGNLEAEVEKRAKELEESELRYRELYNNIIDGVILVDPMGIILMSNPQFPQMSGIPDQDPTGLSFIGFVHSQDRHLVKDRILSGLTKGLDDVNNIEFRIGYTKSNHIFVECNARRIVKENLIVGIQMVLRDVTERKQLENNLVDSYKKLKQTRTAAILGLAKLAEYRDGDTGSHLERIREYSKILAEELAKHPKYQQRITPEFIEDIYLSSILHDIGKVGIPDSILSKPGKLTDEEYELVKMHSIYGGDALKSAESMIEGPSFLTLGKEIAYYHHEKWNGSGYPMGLKREEIPLSTRLVALADVYDALTSKRSYKEAYSHEKTMDIIISEKNKHFDPDVVDAFLRREKEFNKIRRELQNGCDNKENGFRKPFRRDL